MTSRSFYVLTRVFPLGLLKLNLKPTVRVLTERRGQVFLIFNTRTRRDGIPSWEMLLTEAFGRSVGCSYLGEVPPFLIFSHYCIVVKHESGLTDKRLTKSIINSSLHLCASAAAATSIPYCTPSRAIHKHSKYISNSGLSPSKFRHRHPTPRFLLSLSQP